MQNVRYFLAIILLSAALAGRTQDQAVILNYIQTYKEMAIAEMQRTGVPASIKLAQGIHETMAGTSVLCMKSNNHFGIKCKATWRGESVTHDDDARGECFRKYPSSEDSYRDHSDFLKGSARYSPLFKLDPLDYSGWAWGLKKAGYATNPKYPQIIIKIVKEYNLQDYTLIALGKGPGEVEVMAQSEEERPAVKNDEAVMAAVSVVHNEEKKIVEAIGEPDVPAYPAGEFRINETRVIYARKGTSFLSIAQQYNIPLAWIFDFNELPRSEELGQGQLIYIQRKRKAGNKTYHIVKPGETIYGIAQQEAVRLESVLEYNQLQRSMQPAAGERIYLRSNAPRRPVLAGKQGTGQDLAMVKSENTSYATNNEIMEEVAHIVQPKETIYSISKKHNVRIEDIVRWNQLSGYELKTGQQLKIYK